MLIVNIDMRDFLRFIGRPIFALLFSVEYRGLENIPDDGPVIIAGNHPSYLDPVLVALPVRRIIRFMAWDALFKVPLLGALIRALGAFPVDIRRGRGEAAFREACKILRGGEALGIFPEGQRSERGPMGELRTGVARLAIETGAPIVPVTIGGAYRAWPKWKLLPKPAKIIVNYHKPIHLEDANRASLAEDREYHHRLMEQVAASINRSLTPALHGSAALERLYAQPPSHIRTYEWVPLATALVSTIILVRRGKLESWPLVWIMPAIYYAYLLVDLVVIRQSRTTKWLRNSMPVWLIFSWHYPLVRATGLPEGNLNWLLAVLLLTVFFRFFWEDYYTLQKFVRGLVVVYYSALALELGWPHDIGVLVAVTGFVGQFGLRYRTRYRLTAAIATAFVIGYALATCPSISPRLPFYGILSVATVAYLGTFASAAYDIRRIKAEG